MSNLRYRITTLGCRVNHAETRELESVLIDLGLTAAGPEGPVDLEVVHTCSVTSAAVRKSRNAARRARRGSAGSRPHVVVTGCFAGTDPDEAALIAGSSANAIPHQTSDDGATMVERFTRRVQTLLKTEIRRRHSGLNIRRASGTCSGEAGRDSVFSLPVRTPRAGAGRHIRAELKIQDGCDAFCTFCIIPRIRSNVRSKSITDAVKEARNLVDLGHREIVLTGIFIGAYGHETALRRRQQNRGSRHLADLLDAVAQVEGLARLRISSMEPGDVTESLLDAMAANAPVVVPHLHLPLQSGSDRILKRMNRQYRVGEYLEMIDMVNEALTEGRRADGRGFDRSLPPAMTTDIICGFPGESEQDFEKTVEVVQRVGYLHMHVFPFSPRAGTAAARWTDQFVPHDVKKSRVRRLIDLEQDPDRGFSIRYRRKLLGRTIRVILEQPDREDRSFMTGRCDRYALVHLLTNKPRGTIVNARITNVSPAHTIGELPDVRLPLPVLQRSESV